MTFVDPETGLVINCQPWEYEQLKPKFIKTKWESGGEGKEKENEKENTNGNYL